MRFGVIYRAVSPSGHVYIGQTLEDFKKRMYHHIYDAHHKKGDIFNTKFSCAIRKYSDQLKWEVLYRDIPEDLLDIAEICVIYIFDSYENGYNSTLGGGNNCMKGKHHTQDSKDKISIANKGQQAWNKGKHHSCETKKKMSKSRTGRHLSEEAKQHLSTTRRGKDNPNFGGKSCTEETRKKLSISHSGENHPLYGKKHSEESKKKMSESHIKIMSTKHRDVNGRFTKK
jgi:hypothetical protein